MFSYCDLESKSQDVLNFVWMCCWCREIARMLADEHMKRVVIVDTSNEIGGDGDVPHAGIGRARRMQVPNVNMQHNVSVGIDYRAHFCHCCFSSPVVLRFCNSFGCIISFALSFCAGYD